VSLLSWDRGRKIPFEVIEQFPRDDTSDMSLETEEDASVYWSDRDDDTSTGSSGLESYDNQMASDPHDNTAGSRVGVYLDLPANSHVSVHIYVVRGHMAENNQL
jgi:hypothetical protein